MENLKKIGDFDLQPYAKNDLDSRKDLVKLKVSPAQSNQISALFSNMPALVAENALANAYYLKFPEGVSGSLIQLKAGGYSSVMQGADGKIVGHASLHSLSPQTMILSAFTAMSIASGQYFLAQINAEMKKMNEGIEKILEFLYGDKKAELMSELMFVKHAYQNYQYVSSCYDQKAATIISLQEARKVAMKDIEFYITDLDSVVKSRSDSFVDKAFQIKESLELSMQLYVLSMMLEVYYSENFDKNYISNLGKEMNVYIAKCESRILNSFSELKGIVAGMPQLPFAKLNKAECDKKITEVTSNLTSGEESELRKSIRVALDSVMQKSEYYICDNGDIYMKAS